MIPAQVQPATRGLATAAMAAGVTASIDVSCILKCGAGALKCIPCGTNIACWATCAGPDIVSCVMGCL